MTKTNIKFMMHKFNGTVKLTLIFGYIALIAACGSQVDDINSATGDTSKTSSQSITLTNLSDSKLLASLAATYPNGQLPADLQAAASAQLAQNPAVLKLGSVQMSGSQVSNAQAYYQPAATTAAIYKPVYRIQNTTLTGSYFFSIYETEGSTALDTNPSWNYEGPAFEASLVQGDGLSPVWRFRNVFNGSYVFTIFESERASLASTYASTFVYEGVAWYASQVAAPGLTALYRFRNLTNGTYLFSAYEEEKNAIIANYAAIFVFEGVSYYVKPASAPAPFASKLPDTGSTKCFKKLTSYSQDQQPLVDCTDPAAVTADSLQDGMIGHDKTHPLSLDGRLGFSYSNVAGYSKTDCVKDNITGLVWEGKPTSGFRTDRGYTNYGDGRAGDISEYVRQVNEAALCGKTDWRIPAVNELHGLLDYGVVASATKYTGNPMIDTKWFPNTTVGEYWTSTQATSVINAPEMPADKIWVVSFWGGEKLTVGTASANYSSNRARLVSGNTSNSSSRYTISTDGKEVTDSSTGLIWRRCAEGRVWDANQAKCLLDFVNFPYLAAYPGPGAPPDVVFQGDAARIHTKSQNGWRIPNIKELKSLQTGGFDQAIFPNTVLAYGSSFRSSTPNSKLFLSTFLGGSYWTNHESWAVWLGTGHVVSKGDEYGFSLRLVR